MAWALGHHLVAWPGGVTGLCLVPRSLKTTAGGLDVPNVPQPLPERKPGVDGDRADGEGGLSPPFFSREGGESASWPHTFFWGPAFQPPHF